MCMSPGRPACKAKRARGMHQKSTGSLHVCVPLPALALLPSCRSSSRDRLRNVDTPRWASERDPDETLRSLCCKANSYACICMSISFHVHVYVHTPTYKHHTCMHADIHTYVRTYIHTHIRTYADTQLYTTYVYTLTYHLYVSVTYIIHIYTVYIYILCTHICTCRRRHINTLWMNVTAGIHNSRSIMQQLYEGRHLFTWA